MRHKVFTICASLWLAAIICIPANGQAGLVDTDGCQKPVHCTNCCGVEPCVLMCCPEWKTVKEKTHCWEVDCEYICVPQVQCPSLLTLLGFNSDHGAACDGCGRTDGTAPCCKGMTGSQTQLQGKIRAVRKLRKVESEVEKRVVEWTVKTCSMDAGKSCIGLAPRTSCAPAF